MKVNPKILFLLIETASSSLINWRHCWKKDDTALSISENLKCVAKQRNIQKLPLYALCDFGFLIYLWVLTYFDKQLQNLMFMYNSKY